MVRRTGECSWTEARATARRGDAHGTEAAMAKLRFSRPTGAVGADSCKELPERASRGMATHASGLVSRRREEYAETRRGCNVLRQGGGGGGDLGLRQGQAKCVHARRAYSRVGDAVHGDDAGRGLREVP